MTNILSLPKIARKTEYVTEINDLEIWYCFFLTFTIYLFIYKDRLKFKNLNLLNLEPWQRRPSAY